MSRGPGTRQLEILRRLELLRSRHLPDLWHALHGNPNNAWPDPKYSGAFLNEVGQGLALYGRGSSRSVRVAYRRAAAALERTRRIEIRPRALPTDKIYVRLPMTEREKIAVRGLRRRAEDYRNSFVIVQHEDLVKLGERDRERETARDKKHREVMNYLWSLGRYPPLEVAPPEAAKILREGPMGIRALNLPALRGDPRSLPR